MIFIDSSWGAPICILVKCAQLSISRIFNTSNPSLSSVKLSGIFLIISSSIFDWIDVKSIGWLSSVSFSILVKVFKLPTGKIGESTISIVRVDSLSETFIRTGQLIKCMMFWLSGPRWTVVRFGNFSNLNILFWLSFLNNFKVPFMLSRFTS